MFRGAAWVKVDFLTASFVLLSDGPSRRAFVFFDMLWRIIVSKIFQVWVNDYPLRKLPEFDPQILIVGIIIGGPRCRKLLAGGPVYTPALQ